MTKSNKEIADRLVELCKAGDDSRTLDELYHPDAVSVEAVDMPGMDSRETKGLDGIRAKHDWWNSAMEMHSASVEGPFPHGEDRFAVIFEMDVTERASGNRMQSREVGIYHTANGQITREEFFYSM
ncbi:MAG: nuclear transport factor 2 family protein [Pseudomonadota bacterium]